MIFAYDADVWNVRVKAKMASEQAAEKIRALEANAEMHKKNYELAVGRVHELESE